MHWKNDSYLHIRAYGRFHKLSADGLSQVNKIDVHNLCHHCRIHNVFYFRCVVHHIVLFFISFSSPTFIIYLSLYLIIWLSLSLSYVSLSPLSSATFTVTLQTCKPSSSLYLAHSLALINHPHPLYSLLFWMQPLCLSLSLSLFLPQVNSQFSNM